MKHNSLLASIMALLGSATTSAADMPQADVKGAVDNPLLSRYSGALIVYSSTGAFDETDLVAGKYKHSDSAPAPLPFPLRRPSTSKAP
jgi:ethanolamine utilization microcompartment shell protein EutS